MACICIRNSTKSATIRATNETFLQWRGGRMMVAEGRRLLEIIAKLIFNLIKGQSFDAVGGLEIGAYPIATSVSDRVFQETGAEVRAFVVRKEQKKHGVGRLIAGDARPGDKTLIVDDVVTTGGSTIDAITRARKAGLHVNKVIVLIDREEDEGKRNIEAHDVDFTALFTLADLLRVSEAHATADTRTDPA